MTCATHCLPALQRIENHWNYVWGHFAWYWRQVFEALEDLGLLDRWAFVYCDWLSMWQTLF